MVSIMSGLKADISGDFREFRQFIKTFPKLRAEMLSSVGKQARLTLKAEFLSGQELDLRRYPKDRAGRHTVSSKVQKRATKVSIWSYPVNLFENGRRLRSGKKESGKKIITVKFKNSLNGKLQSYADRAYRRTIAKAMEKV